MILTLKVKDCYRLNDGRVRIMLNAEDLKEALSAHSPNILIDHINEQCKLKIPHVSRKEATHDTSNR